MVNTRGHAAYITQTGRETNVYLNEDHATMRILKIQIRSVCSNLPQSLCFLEQLNGMGRRETALSGGDHGRRWTEILRSWTRHAYTI